MGGGGGRRFIVSIVSANFLTKTGGFDIMQQVSIIYRNLFRFKKNPIPSPTSVINGYEEAQHCILSLCFQSPPSPSGHRMVIFLKNKVYGFPTSICSKSLHPNHCSGNSWACGDCLPPCSYVPWKAVISCLKPKVSVSSALQVTRPAPPTSPSNWDVAQVRGATHVMLPDFVLVQLSAVLSQTIFWYEI